MGVSSDAATSAVLVRFVLLVFFLLLLVLSVGRVSAAPPLGFALAAAVAVAAAVTLGLLPLPLPLLFGFFLLRDKRNKRRAPLMRGRETRAYIDLRCWDYSKKVIQLAITPLKSYLITPLYFISNPLQITLLKES